MNSLRVFLYAQPLVFLFCILAFVVSLRCNSSRTRWLRGLISCCAGLVLGTVIELNMKTPQAILLAGYTSYVFIAFMPVCWLMLSLDMSGERASFIRQALLPVSIIPLATSILIWTNPLHHLIWEKQRFVEIDGFLVHLVDVYGPWFWIHVIWSYLLFIVGSIILILEYSKHHRIYRKQASLVIVGVALPLVFNLLYLGRLFGITIRDWSVLMISISCLLFSLALTRYGLGQASLLKREHLYNLLDDMILLLDDRLRICDINEVCLRRLNLSADQWIGKAAAELIPELDSLSINGLPIEGKAEADFCLEPGHRLFAGRQMRLECRLRPLVHFKDQSLQGYRISLTDLANEAFRPLEDSSVTRSPAIYSGLSRREQEVYLLLKEGKTNKQISSQLFVSEATVKTHVHNLLRKMGVKKRSDLLDLG